MGNQPTYQGLYDRMLRWDELPDNASGAQTLERTKALEAMMRDMLELALSEKKS